MFPRFQLPVPGPRKHTSHLVSSCRAVKSVRGSALWRQATQPSGIEIGGFNALSPLRRLAFSFVKEMLLNAMLSEL